MEGNQVLVPKGYQVHVVYYNQNYINQFFQGAWNHMAQPRIPFLATLNFPDLLKFTNDLFSHDPIWLVVPTNIPLEIRKFKGNNGEET